MTAALLEVDELSLRAGDATLVHGLSFTARPSETLGIVGESGSGKSLTMLSVMGLLAHGVRVAGGQARYDGEDLLVADEERMRRVRGPEIAMVYQDPLTSLNPVLRIGRQIEEGMVAHGVPAAEARERAVSALRDVGIPAPEATLSMYPHNLSGGMRQRVVIAAAMAMRPRLLIADEPTTALDVTIQQQIVALIARAQDDTGLGVIWVSHDLGVIARIADRVLVMYAGRIVEEAPVAQLFAAPQHPYTHALLDALPDPDDDRREPLAQLGGTPPDPTAPPRGCPFGPRCPQRRPACELNPPLEAHGAGRVACWVPRAEWGT